MIVVQGHDSGMKNAADLAKFVRNYGRQHLSLGSKFSIKPSFCVVAYVIRMTSNRICEIKTNLPIPQLSHALALANYFVMKRISSPDPGAGGRTEHSSAIGRHPAEHPSALPNTDR